METYEGILARMTDKYTELSGNTPEEASDISVRLRVLAGEIYSSLVNIEWLKRQMFADTAEGAYLDYHAAARGLSRRDASCAVGSVIFSVSEAAVSKISIPAGTVVATDSQTPLRFETVESVTIPAGGTSVHAQIKALLPGKAYNVSAGAISVMVTPPAGVESVTNPDPCTSGSDVEDDEKLRSRIIDSYKNVSNGTNCAYYRTIATEIPGVVSAGVMPRARGAGTVDVYIAGEGTEVSDEVLGEVQSRLSKLREVNVDVLVQRAIPQYVTFYVCLDVKDGYEFDDVKERCRAELKDYVSTRGVGGNVLMNEVIERMYHVEGVKDYSFPTVSNFNLRCTQDKYPVPHTMTFVQGVTG